MTPAILLDKENINVFLLTGGAGIISSRTAEELLNAGYEVVIADDLSNSGVSVIDRIKTITGKHPAFYRIDVADRAQNCRSCVLPLISRPSPRTLTSEDTENAARYSNRSACLSLATAAAKLKLHILGNRVILGTAGIISDFSMV